MRNQFVDMLEKKSTTHNKKGGKKRPTRSLRKEENISRNEKFESTEVWEYMRHTDDTSRLAGQSEACIESKGGAAAQRHAEGEEQTTTHTPGHCFSTRWRPEPVLFFEPLVYPSSMFIIHFRAFNDLAFLLSKRLFSLSGP